MCFNSSLFLKLYIITSCPWRKRKRFHAMCKMVERTWKCEAGALNITYCPKSLEMTRAPLTAPCCLYVPTVILQTENKPNLPKHSFGYVIGKHLMVPVLEHFPCERRVLLCHDRASFLLRENLMMANF